MQRDKDLGVRRKLMPLIVTYPVPGPMWETQVGMRAEMERASSGPDTRQTHSRKLSNRLGVHAVPAQPVSECAGC